MIILTKIKVEKAMRRLKQVSFNPTVSTIEAAAQVLKEVTDFDQTYEHAVQLLETTGRFKIEENK